MLWRSLLIWCRLTCIFLFLLSSPKNHCQDQFQGAYYPLYFLLGVLWFYVSPSSLWSINILIWFDFCVWCKIGVQLFIYLFFACGYPVYPPLLTEETLISPSYIFCSLVDGIFIFWGSWFCSICLCICLCQYCTDLITIVL